MLYYGKRLLDREGMIPMGIHDGHRDRMRARFLRGGLGSFAPHEALELLLFYAIPQKDTNGLAHALMDRYGSLSAVLNAPVEDLVTVDGIREKTAVLLHLVPQLWELARMEETLRQEVVLDSSDRAGRFLADRLAGEKTEVIYLLCLDAGCGLIYCERLEEGSANRAHLSVRRVVESAILHAANRVILGHNHPGGSPAPSPEDIGTTEQVRAALNAIDVVLDDHIIVAGERFASMRQLGCL